MKTSFRESFEKDIRVIREKSILVRIKTVIELVEAAPDMRAITESESGNIALVSL